MVGQGEVGSDFEANWKRDKSTIGAITPTLIDNLGRVPNS